MKPRLDRNSRKTVPNLDIDRLLTSHFKRKSRVLLLLCAIRIVTQTRGETLVGAGIAAAACGSRRI